MRTVMDRRFNARVHRSNSDQGVCIRAIIHLEMDGPYKTSPSDDSGWRGRDIDALQEMPWGILGNSICNGLGGCSDHNNIALPVSWHEGEASGERGGNDRRVVETTDSGGCGHGPCMPKSVRALDDTLQLIARELIKRH